MNSMMQAAMLQREVDQLHSQAVMERQLRLIDQEIRSHHDRVHARQLERFHGLIMGMHGNVPHGADVHALGNWSSHADGVATAVIDGDVYVNGQWVAQVPPGRPAAVAQADGVVQVNGEVVWTHPEIWRQQQALVREAIRCSVLVECKEDREDPCPVCLEQIRAGQQCRMLPCFHALHGPCAEAHFVAAAEGSLGTARRRGRRIAAGQTRVLCPLCRAQVGAVDGNH